MGTPTLHYAFSGYPTSQMQRNRKTRRDRKRKISLSYAHDARGVGKGEKFSGEVTKKKNGGERKFKSQGQERGMDDVMPIESKSHADAQ